MRRPFPGPGIPLAYALILCFIQPVCAEEEAEAESELIINETLVTALRVGEERLQDAHMSISVVDSKSIDRNGMVEMNDYLRVLPSTSFIDKEVGRNNVIIRGEEYRK